MDKERFLRAKRIYRYGGYRTYEEWVRAYYKSMPAVINILLRRY